MIRTVAFKFERFSLPDTNSVDHTVVPPAQATPQGLNSGDAKKIPVRLVDLRYDGSMHWRRHFDFVGRPGTTPSVKQEILCSGDWRLHPAPDLYCDQQKGREADCDESGNLRGCIPK
jgi:hypothetical protein